MVKLTRKGQGIAASLKLALLSRHNWQSPWSAFHFFLQTQGTIERSDRATRFHIQGLPFDIHPADWFAFREIILAQEYRFISDLFHATFPEVIIDLGAHIGLFSIYALSLWPIAQVHSFEASPSTGSSLRHNQGLNPQLNWRTYQYAIWERDGKVGFRTNEVSTGSHVVPGPSEEKVPAITLETLCSKYIGSSALPLVKMDIEGAEEVVLRSSVHLLSRIENLIVEVHPNRCDRDYVVSVLQSSFGYLYRTTGRLSSKPVFLACRQPRSLPLCHLK